MAVNPFTTKMGTSRASESELIGSDEPPTPDSQILFKINNRTDDSLECTRRMKQLVDESRNAGTASLTALHHQGQQLDQIEDDLNAIDGQVGQTAKIVSQMEQCCCYDLCCCCCRKKEDEEEEGVTWKRETNSVTVFRSQSQLDRSYTSGYSLASSFSGGLVNRVTNDFREDEMESNLHDVGSMIGVLRSMAMDQGTTIEQQNEQISRINDKAVADEGKMKGLSKRMENLLK